MNILQRAYEEGVKLAEGSHGVGKLVAPGAPKSHAPTPSTTMTKSPTVGAVSTPSGGGGGKSPTMTSSTMASTIPSLAPGAFGKGLPPQSTITPQSLSQQAAGAGAGSVFQLGSAGQRHSIRTMGTELPGIASPVTGGGGTQPSGVKAGEFNMGMTPDPASKPDKTPAPDNGRRMMGTNFNDPQRPLNDINSAWSALSIPKNTDVLNEAGQMEFGAPRG